MTIRAALLKRGWQQRLSTTLKRVEREVRNLASAQAMLLRDANPPELPGVYLFSSDGEILYVGEARGSGGLYDRICRKHVSGSDSHPLQRAFMVKFPDRSERREYLKNHIAV
jgi:hypothetical protein